MRPAAPLLSLIALPLACVVGGDGARSPMSFWGFTGPWDPRSHTSLRAHASQLDVAVTGWIGLDSLSGEPLLPSVFPDTIRLPGGTAERFGLVTSWHGQGFHAAPIRRLGESPARLAKVAGAIAAHAASLRYTGLVLDFETLEPQDVAALLRVVRSIRDSAAARGVHTVAVAVPAEADRAYPPSRLLEVADLLLVMLYDQHWAGSQPGPISSPDWVHRSLERFVQDAGAARLVAGLPLYGYHWRGGRSSGDAIGFEEAVRIATAGGTALRRDSTTRTMRASVGTSEIWVTDAELLAVLARDVEQLGVRRIALWRLGQEDPAIWTHVVHRPAGTVTR